MAHISRKSCNMSSAAARGVVAVVGVGPGLGRSIARRFAHEGYTIAILSRNLDRLSVFADEIAREENAQVFAIRIDCSDATRVKEAFESIHSLGFVEVLVYNVSPSPALWCTQTAFTDIPLESVQEAVSVSVVGAFQCAQQVIPGMLARRKGTILFTGCAQSITGAAGLSPLACSKFAVRGLAQCLAREYQTQGIHVAHVVLDGVAGGSLTHWTTSLSSCAAGGGGGSGSGRVHNTDGYMDPDAIAQAYWQLHTQDRSAWTHELDLRSFCSGFPSAN